MLRKLWLLLQCVVVILVVSLLLFAWQQQQALQQTLAVDETRMLEVLPGATPAGTLARLEQEEVLKNVWLLRLYWQFNMGSPALHVGEYQLQPDQTAQDLLTMWQLGDVLQRRLTLVEGWTFRQVRNALASQERLRQSVAELADKAVIARLDIKVASLEGQFFPDTYSYVSGMTDLDILRQAHQRLQRVLAEEWAGRAEGLPYQNPYDALIMASMIEKETGVPHERDMIAGVFVRRLRARMRLQTDPTVIYGMGERYRGRLSRADLRESTPYNTYVIDGMPPTPIALAGREAIHAALNPAPGKTLYFVARGDGSHEFSNTLTEHNKAVRRYQLNRRADYRSSPVPESPQR